MRQKFREVARLVAGEAQQQGEIQGEIFEAFKLERLVKQLGKTDDGAPQIKDTADWLRLYVAIDLAG